MLLCKRHEIGEIAVVIKKKYGITKHTLTHICIFKVLNLCITQDIYYNCNNECLQQRMKIFICIMICNLNSFANCFKLKTIFVMFTKAKFMILDFYLISRVISFIKSEEWSR